MFDNTGVIKIIVKSFRYAPIAAFAKSRENRRSQTPGAYIFLKASPRFQKIPCRFELIVVPDVTEFLAGNIAEYPLGVSFIGDITTGKHCAVPLNRGCRVQPITRLLLIGELFSKAGQLLEKSPIGQSSRPILQKNESVYA